MKRLYFMEVRFQPGDIIYKPGWKRTSMKLSRCIPDFYPVWNGPHFGSVSYREKIRNETDLHKIEPFHSGFFPGMKRTSFWVRFIPGKNQLGRELDSFTVGSGFFLDSVVVHRAGHSATKYQNVLLSSSRSLSNIFYLHCKYRSQSFFGCQIV